MRLAAFSAGTQSLAAAGGMPTICADVIARTRYSRESNWQSGSSGSSAKYKDCVYHIITFPLLLCLLALQVWAHTALTIKGFQKKEKKKPAESEVLGAKPTVGEPNLTITALFAVERWRKVTFRCSSLHLASHFDFWEMKQKQNLLPHLTCL